MTDLRAYEHNGRPVGRAAFYAVACDPRRSVAVEACAGAGKTWMLVSRILRALLEGAEPHQILAITFTKKAAGEMRQRLQEWLETFAQATPEQLQEALEARGVAPAQAAALRDPLKALHGRLLGLGRPVQIRTFHSWFAALLRSAPLAVLEALGLPARHELLEDDSEAVALVWRRFHAAVAADAAARADFEACVATHGRFQTHKALLAALAKRVEFSLADELGVVAGSVQPAGVQFPQFAGLAHPCDVLAGEAARARWLGRARALGAEANKTPQKAAQWIVDAFECADLAERFARLRKVFFVAAEDRLTIHLQKFAAAQEAEPELQALCGALAQHEAWLHHQRLARLTRELVAAFSALKRERGWIDMNDVERAGLVMLSDPVLSGWVQERLDTQVRHLLIDEFQDTNPLQWQALHGWLSGYAGAGGNAPGLFIVGDPKQSIYRFRRAEPQVFGAAKDFIRELGGDVLSCDHTHRNAPEVLAVVNAVMGAAQADGDYDGYRAHTTESGLAGRVQRLPAIPRQARAVPDAAGGWQWRDTLTVPRELPEERLTTLECRQAAGWVATRLAAGIRPQDILVLARKRDRLAAMEEALRALRIPAQQPEKNELGEAPEVQDLVALLDVLVSPTHDLSLARALKSPLFAVPDDALVQLASLAREAQAQGRPAPWIEWLPHAAERHPSLAGIAGRLARWKARVDALPPHDALDTIFHEGDVLARYAAAAPPPLRAAVLANLRALLGAALEVDGARYATPYAFVRALRAGGIRAPAIAEAAAVRLLTVHGAKGLEADVVLMLDTDAAPPRAQSMGVVVEWPGEAPAPWRFSFIASESRPPPCSAEALAVERTARLREELNGLYVAMTRARRQLVLSCVEPASPDPGSWWRRLETLCDPLPAPAAVVPAASAQADPVLLPEVPLRSAAAAVAPRADAAPPASAQARFGQAVHRLLELHTGAAAGWSPAQRERVAREFALAAPVLRDAVGMAQRIVAGEGAWAWDPAQVDWAGNEVELLHAGERLRLDRLVRRRDTGAWWVLDYKSLGRPEQDAALIEQMRRYREAVRAAYPGATVEVAFLTGPGRLVPLA